MLQYRAVQVKDVSPFPGFQKKTSKGTGQRCPSQKGHGGEPVRVQEEAGRASAKKMVESDTVHQEIGERPRHRCWHLVRSLSWELGKGDYVTAAAAAAKSLQSCPTLCEPIDGSPPSSPVPGILQARRLEWVAISFSNAWKWKVKVKALSRVWLLATPWTAAHQAPPSMGFSRQEYWSGCHWCYPFKIPYEGTAVLETSGFLN